MTSNWLRFPALGLLVVALALTGCGSSGTDGLNGADGSDGTDGTDGATGEPGAPGGSSINASQVSDDFLAGLEVQSEILAVEIASPPVVTFSLESSTGVPITGIVPFWEASNRYVRFTMAKLVPGANGDPDSWVSYTRDDTSGEPDYDTGASLVDNGDGSYTFTFLTDVTAVTGIPYEPTLTHRVAGQMGDRSVPLQPQNFVYDYVPAGGAVSLTHNIATMASCNECHDDLVFHGRRFEVEYCVNCHNADLASGEGDMAFMIHKIHAAGKFDILDHAIDYGEVTYPQDLANCRKCHTADDAATVDGDNWKNVPNIAACDGCHNNFSVDPSDPDYHTGGEFNDNAACAMCHDAAKIEGYHTTPNATANNPGLLASQRSITYELIDASVDGSNNVTVNLKVYSDGTELDLTNLPTDLLVAGRYPGLLLAWALPQSGNDNPMDYNNIGRKSAQPLNLGLDKFDPIETTSPLGTLSFSGGVNTVVIEDGPSQFPVGATLRAVGLQGYLRQDLDGDGAYDVSLHTPSAVVAVTGDDVRRSVVDSASCSSCHEWFEGHGGNRVYNIQICTLCHVPNLSSGGRMITSPPSQGYQDDIQAAIDAGHLDGNLVDPADPLTWPEDAQNLKDMVHGIHSSGFRDRAFVHVRGGSHGGVYDWSHVTFPRGASTSNCTLCHEDGTYELPLAQGLLATTVRTTQVDDGQDATTGDAVIAFEDVPNDSDWVNTPAASSCFYCHTSWEAGAHMVQNGALLSVFDGSWFTNRKDLGTTFESCSVCHGPGKVADLELVHNK